jgi:hypothetical protein
VFFLLAVFVFRKVVSGKSLSKFLLKTNLKARHLPLLLRGDFKNQVNEDTIKEEQI